MPIIALPVLILILVVNLLVSMISWCIRHILKLERDAKEGEK